MDPCLNPITFYPYFHPLFWGKKGNFEVYHDGDFFDLPYDYNSIMHYSGKEFYCCFNYSIFYLTYPNSTLLGRAWSKCKSAKCITIETRDPAMQKVLFGLFAIIASYIYSSF